MSQRELQKVSDLRDASSQAGFRVRGPDDSLTWRKSEGLILCQKVQKFTIQHKICLMFLLLVLKFREECELFLGYKWNTDANGGATTLTK